MTRRLVPFAAIALALAAADSKKEAPAIKVAEIAIHRADSTITIDGRIANSGAQPIHGLVLIFDVLGDDGQLVNRQRGAIDEDPLDPGAESEMHWQMKDHPRAVEIRVRAVAKGDAPVKVEQPGPYPIE